jgi:predicted ATPase
VPEATYQFKHALIRDAAYDALLKSRRNNPAKERP